MKKLKIIMVMVFVLGIFLSFRISTNAETDNVYQYSINNEEVTITGVTSKEEFSGKQVIPDKIEGYPVTKIRFGAFSNCMSLTSITIPDTVVDIGFSAFDECTSLEEITMPKDVYGTEEASRFGYIFGYQTLADGPILHYQPSYPALNPEYTIGTYAPEGKTYQNYTYPYKEWHTGIAYNHYRRYYYYNIPTSLKKVKITNDTVIDANAFYNCNNLKEIVLCNQISTIEQNAFYNCSGIETIYFNGGATQWNEINIDTTNTAIENATKRFIFYVTIYGENGKTLINKTYEENSILNIPKKDGYIPKLFTDTDCTNEFEPTTPITKNLILHLRYQLIQTTTSIYKYDKFNLLTITPHNVEIGNSIILALYTGDTLTDVHADTFKGNDIQFITDTPYTAAKIFVWNSLQDSIPLCAPEILE